MCVSCGFHLRTESLASYISSVEVTGTSSPRIVRSLERKLDEIGVAVDAPPSPDVRVQITQHSIKKEASLLAPSGGMIEYELTLTVDYKIGLPNIEADSDVISLSTTRPVKVNAENLLSTSTEDQLVRRELIDTIADEIIRNIPHELEKPSNTNSNEGMEG